MVLPQTKTIALIIVNTDLTVHNCSHYNELYLAGLGPPEAQVRLIGRYRIVTGLGLTKDSLGGQIAQD